MASSSDMDMDVDVTINSPLKPCDGKRSIEQALVPNKDSSIQFSDMKEDCERIHAGNTGCFDEKNILLEMDEEADTTSTTITGPDLTKESLDEDEMILTNVDTPPPYWLRVPFDDPVVVKGLEELHEYPEYMEFIERSVTMRKLGVFDNEVCVSLLKRALQIPQVKDACGRLWSVSTKTLCSGGEYERVHGHSIVKSGCSGEKQIHIGMAEVFSLVFVDGFFGKCLIEMEDNESLESSILGREDESGELDFVHQLAADGKFEDLKKRLDQGIGEDEMFDSEGRTPLFYACQYGQVECAKILVKYGVDVNAIDTALSTALHFAAFYGKEECVALLLEHDADVSYENQRGNRPWECAKCSGHASDDLVKLLEELSWSHWSINPVEYKFYKEGKK